MNYINKQKIFLKQFCSKSSYATDYNIQFKVIKISSERVTFSSLETFRSFNTVDHFHLLNTELLKHDM